MRIIRLFQSVSAALLILNQVLSFMGFQHKDFAGGYGPGAFFWSTLGGIQRIPIKEHLISVISILFLQHTWVKCSSCTPDRGICTDAVYLKGLLLARMKHCVNKCSAWYSQFILLLHLLAVTWESRQGVICIWMINGFGPRCCIAIVWHREDVE